NAGGNGFPYRQSRLRKIKRSVVHHRRIVVETNRLIVEGKEREVARYVWQIRVGECQLNVLGPVGALMFVQQPDSVAHLVQPSRHRTSAAAFQSLLQPDHGTNWINPEKSALKSAIAVVRLELLPLCT